MKNMIIKEIEILFIEKIIRKNNGKDYENLK